MLVSLTRAPIELEIFIFIRILMQLITDEIIALVRSVVADRCGIASSESLDDIRECDLMYEARP